MSRLYRQTKYGLETSDSKTTPRPIEIYTDGSFIVSNKTGGWGYVVVKDGKVIKKAHGAEKNTTCNRMELTAVIEALEHTTEPVVIVTDSKYCYNGVKVWVKQWKRNHWRRSKNKMVKNKDLWQRLDSLWRDNVDIVWIKGNNGNKFNNLAHNMSQTYLK